MQVVIRIKGHLDQSWQQWLDGLQIVQESGGTTRLCGTLPEQPALYGVLNKIDGLSLTLLSRPQRNDAQRGLTGISTPLFLVIALAGNAHSGLLNKFKNGPLHKPNNRVCFWERSNLSGMKERHIS